MSEFSSTIGSLLVVWTHKNLIRERIVSEFSLMAESAAGIASFAWTGREFLHYFRVIRSSQWYRHHCDVFHFKSTLSFLFSSFTILFYSSIVSHALSGRPSTGISITVACICRASNNFLCHLAVLLCPHNWTCRCCTCAACWLILPNPSCSTMGRCGAPVSMNSIVRWWR